MYKPHSYYPDITVDLYPHDFCAQIKKLSYDDLKVMRDKLSKFYERADDFAAYALKVAEEEGDFLPFADYVAIENAYDRMYRLMKDTDEVLDAIEEIIQAWDAMESNLQFVFDMDDVMKQTERRSA